MGTNFRCLFGIVGTGNLRVYGWKALMLLMVNLKLIQSGLINPVISLFGGYWCKKNNRYQNSSLFILEQTNNSLVEESEFYSFHRHAVAISSGNYNTIRRNYVNSRNHRDISGGRYSSPANRGDGGIVIYPGSNNIVENNIVENASAAFGIEALGITINNRLLGNMALNNYFGAIFSVRGNSLDKMPQNTWLENHVALNSTYYGAYFRGNKNTTCKNCTSLDSGFGGFAADKPSFPGIAIRLFIFKTL